MLIGVLACVVLTIQPDAFALDKNAPGDDIAGWNLFSVEQDIQLGNEAAARFEAAIQLVQENRLNNYFNRLGEHLASTLPQTHFPFSFKLIADESLQAFSFPGGPVYCTAGMMAVAEDEAQLAGLMAHQIAHIILRDTTSTASRMKRFRVRAAMAAAATGKKSLLDSLEEIDLHLKPGSTLMHFDLESEQRATKLAAKLMIEAGYPPQEAWTFFQNLQSNHKQQSESYLASHPFLDLDYLETARALQGKPFRLVSKRNFRRMRKQADAIQSENDHLEALVNWVPPAPDQELIATAGPREMYLTSSYSFSYPATWRQAKSNETDRFLVTPKGGAGRSASGERIVTLGVIAGKTEPVTQFQSGTDILLETIREIRPGLSVVSKLDYLATESRPLRGVVLSGPSPFSETRETVWAVSTRLADRVFYLLMIAPESRFTQMKPEFDAILASIKFYAHPEKGLMGDRGQDGSVKRPQLNE